MKTFRHYLSKLILSGCFLLMTGGAFGQGKVLINEYMFWPSNTCGTTSEFVELLNFGPGAVNIGCYILTNGTYSITIPANTILQPGQFYVIAGQNTLPQNCGNIDSAVTVALNWNTCNCTNVPIPTTGDGFMKDGGSANVNLVLLNPALSVVDAVTRSTPVPASTPITTSNVSGACTSKSFNLNSLPVTYETVGESTGQTNSYARKLDGDCDWDKQPQISANATNNSPSVVSEVTYELNIINAMDCSGTKGSIEIYVKFTRDYNEIFPMKYTIIRDVNNNNQVDSNDETIVGYDSIPPDIFIDNLSVGSYTITLESSKGCFLKTIPFSILPCTQVLPLNLIYFKQTHKTASAYTFEWKLASVETFSSVTLEYSQEGRNFITVKVLPADGSAGIKVFTVTTTPVKSFRYYRLRLLSKEGKISYSPILDTESSKGTIVNIWPNPVKDKINIDITSSGDDMAVYQIINAQGVSVAQQKIVLHPGTNRMGLSFQHFASGVYQFVLLSQRKGAEPISLRFVKP